MAKATLARLAKWRKHYSEQAARVDAAMRAERLRREAQMTEGEKGAQFRADCARRAKQIKIRLGG